MTVTINVGYVRFSIVSSSSWPILNDHQVSHNLWPSSHSISRRFAGGLGNEDCEKAAKGSPFPLQMTDRFLFFVRNLA
jgi:hypothetical protein